jgi:hypothetical protein
MGFGGIRRGWLDTRKRPVPERPRAPMTLTNDGQPKRALDGKLKADPSHRPQKARPGSG